MPTIERSIVVNASVEKVFAAADDSHRLREYIVGGTKDIGEIAETHLASQGAAMSFRWMVKMRTGWSGILTMTCGAQGSEIMVTWSFEFWPPGGIFGKVVNWFFVAVNAGPAGKAEGCYGPKFGGGIMKL